MLVAWVGEPGGSFRGGNKAQVLKARIAEFAYLK
jgi:hypothetical protein